MANFNDRAPVFTITKTDSGKRPAIAPRAYKLTAAEWVQRAIDLAWDHHLVGALRFRGLFDGDILYSCRSNTNPDWEYHLHINLEQQHLSCNCAAHQHHLPCGHLGAAFILMRQIQASAVPSSVSGQLRYEDLAAYLDAS